MRLLCAAAVSLLLGLFVVFAEDNKPAETKKVDISKERADKLVALQKKFDAEMDDLKKRAAAAKDQAEIRGIQTEMRETVALTADKALAIVKDDPKDDTGFAAAKFAIESAGPYGSGGLKEVVTILDLLAEHHAANPKIKELLVPVMRIGPAGEKLLKAVVENGTDKETKAVATFLQGYRIAQRVDDEEDEKALAALVKKATELMEKAAQDAPDAKIGKTTTISVAAKNELEALKAIASVTIGKPVPDVEGTNLDGKTVKLSSYKGKVVLLDIWATWCGPCRAMIPHEREMVKSLKDKPFALLSVSCDDEQETLTKFLEKESMPWDHWFDGKTGAVTKMFRVRAFPTLYLIDHTGVIRDKWVGVPDNDKLEKAVEELVAEAVKAKS